MTELDQPQQTQENIFQYEEQSRLQRLGGSIVELGSSLLDEARRPLAIIGAVAASAFAGGAIASAKESSTVGSGKAQGISLMSPAFQESNPGDANSSVQTVFPNILSSSVQKRVKKLNKTCGQPLAVNTSMSSPKALEKGVKTSEGSLRVTNNKWYKHPKFIWHYNKGYTLCKDGLVAIGVDRGTMFPKPDKATKTGGYFVDPYSNDGGQRSTEMFWVYLRHKR